MTQQQRRRTLFSLLLLPAALIQSAASATTSDNRAFYPTYPLNTMCAYTNAARFDLRSYARKYPGDKRGSIQCTSMPAPNLQLAAVYMTQPLMEAAQSHSQAMATGSCFSHETCAKRQCDRYGDCSFGKRLKHYLRSGNLNENTFIGENIARGRAFSDPEKVMAAFIASAGHCNSLVKPEYNRLGLSVVNPGDTFGSRVSQDFAKVDTPARGNIVCGGHVFRSAFLRDFVVSITQAPQDAVVWLVLDRKPLVMSLDIGSVQQGMYKLANVDLRTDRCHQYHFEIVSAGKVVDRYPETGAYFVNGASSKCTVAYSPTAINHVVATAAARTVTSNTTLTAPPTASPPAKPIIKATSATIMAKTVVQPPLPATSTTVMAKTVVQPPLPVTSTTVMAKTVVQPPLTVPVIAAPAPAPAQAVNSTTITAQAAPLNNTNTTAPASSLALVTTARNGTNNTDPAVGNASPITVLESSSASSLTLQKSAVLVASFVASLFFVSI